MNKIKKCAIGVLATVFCGSIAAFAGCQLSDKTVTFMDGDTVHTTVSGKSGDAIDPITLPSKTGYEFSGWKTSGGAEFIPTSIPSNNITVYASYTANPYKIVLSAGDGSGVSQTLDAVYDQTVTIPSVSYSRNGYDFTGWSISRDADAADYNLTDTVKNLPAVKDATVTL